MERLTIKELAPYLPYKLEVKDEEYNEIFEICSYNPSNDEWLVYDNIDGSVVEYCQEILKPLLRPLSSLTEEMYWELSGADKNKSFGFRYGKYNGDSDKRDFISHSGYSERKYFLEDGYGQFPYRMMEFFFKHHFDVFGLIDRGLALPIDGKEVEGE